jgi:hypothetical protein
MYDPVVRAWVTCRAVLPVAILFLGGCVGLGWRFGPWFSSNNKDLFAEPPVVVQRGEQFFLSWTQGSNPFFFKPDYRAMDGRLVFVLASSTSSGNLARQHREMKIEGDENILALHHGGAYWWEPEPEPDGSFVRLQIVKQSL